ncbi:MAG TPA: secondary thiamine-phosphate synthase enzyme YjbQ [Nitrospinota bacterium]|nr:secondary thiamine-phosphate synthase enzyme YjbQ [Nitrospinota bacterium]
MTVETKNFHIHTKGETDILDITPYVSKEIQDSKIRSGIGTVFVSGSTAGITSIEYESGVVQDLKDAIDRMAPRNISYRHDARWGDGNGFAHVRAALLGASFTVPFKDKRMLLGTWQQIVLLDFDNRPRSREILVQVIGE